MEQLPIDERVRQLCAKAAAASEDDAEQLLDELRAALREHASFVRRIATQTLTRIIDKVPSSDKAA